MIQGDVCLYTFKEPDKRRPVLILTRNAAISNLTSISVAQITTSMRDLESVVWLDESDGLLFACVINLDNIQTVPKHRLSKVITHLSDERMQEVFEAIRFAFGFDE